MKILSQKWYLLGIPWTRGEDADTAIIAGSPDPHQGSVVCDIQDFSENLTNNYEAVQIAAHIVELHNQSLLSRTKNGRVESDLQKVHNKTYRIIGPRRAKKLRKRGEYAKWSVELCSYVWEPTTKGGRE